MLSLFLNKDFTYLVQIKKQVCFWVTGLKILGMVGTLFFSEKIILCILKGISPLALDMSDAQMDSFITYQKHMIWVLTVS